MRKLKKGNKRKIIISALLLCAILLAEIPGILSGKIKYVHAKEDEGADERVYIDKVGYPQLSDAQKGKKGNYESAAARLEDMDIVAQDERLILYLDAEFAEFAVEDKGSGAVWFSNPYDFSKDEKSGSEVKNTIQALVNLVYYDSSSNEKTMNSFTDCTSKDQYVVEKLENGFAFHMEIGHKEEGMLVPPVIEASKYESLVLPNISDRNARKLGNYYLKVSLTNSGLSDTVINRYLKDYPGLKENDFYILLSATNRELRNIQEILAETAYTQENMEEDLELSGYINEESADALFGMSMYVELDKGDLKVTIPSDSIRYDDSVYYLASFQVLNYFGAGRCAEDGYLFVPDGSGALIHYNTDGKKKILYTSHTVYGMDYGVNFEEILSSLSAQAYLPMYGNKEGDKAVLAIIEDGDAMSKIISESGNIRSSYETVYPEFNYATTYTVNYTDSTKIRGLYTYHDNNVYAGNYGIRYRFFSGESANYVGMAEGYREYLEQQGILKRLQDGSTGLYLEMLGAIEKTSTKFGIPYVESVALTTFSQAEEILSELEESGAGKLKHERENRFQGDFLYSRHSCHRFRHPGGCFCQRIYPAMEFHGRPGYGLLGGKRPDQFHGNI